MPGIDTSHKYGPRCASSTVRHQHEYTPPPGMPQRCSCGHTRWTVAAGGASTPAVLCAKCTSTNRISSAYERGRVTGFTEANRKEAAPL